MSWGGLRGLIPPDRGVQGRGAVSVRILQDHLVAGRRCPGKYPTHIRSSNSCLLGSAVTSTDLLRHADVLRFKIWTRAGTKRSDHLSRHREQLRSQCISVQRPATSEPPSIRYLFSLAGDDSYRNLSVPPPVTCSATRSSLRRSCATPLRTSGYGFQRLYHVLMDNLNNESDVNQF